MEEIVHDNQYKRRIDFGKCDEDDFLSCVSKI